MQVTALHAYPLKSGRARDLHASRVERSGLFGDRRWAVVDGAGEKISARTDPRLLLIRSQTSELDGIGEDLRLSAPGADDLVLDVPAGDTAGVTIHGDPTPAVFAGAAADAWIEEVLQRSGARLAWCPDPSVRELDPERSRPGDSTAFADGFPLLLATEVSLRQLQDWVAETAVERGEEPAAIAMARFRPNIVLDGDVPFAEDDWREIVIGEGPQAIRLRSTSPCKRCVMTTVDPETLARGPEPIRTLARHRRGLGGTLFAINAVPDAPGTISIGDPVRVS